MPSGLAAINQPCTVTTRSTLTVCDQAAYLICDLHDLILKTQNGWKLIQTLFDSFNSTLNFAMWFTVFLWGFTGMGGARG